jgi:hypothetical protein
MVGRADVLNLNFESSFVFLHESFELIHFALRKVGLVDLWDALASRQFEASILFLHHFILVLGVDAFVHLKEFIIRA